MNSGQCDLLLQPLDEARLEIEEIIPKIDPAREIYPGWTIKEMLAHISGWDEACIDALQAHVSDLPLSTPAIHGLNKYNEMTVKIGKNLTYEQILDEWRKKRSLVRDMIRQLSEEKLRESFAVPWGGKTTVTKLVDIFSRHEKGHARDMLECLKLPEKPLGKAGK